MIIGVVLAGGVGERTGSAIPKQFMKINGHDVISFAIEALKASNSIDKILIAADEKYHDYIVKNYGVDVCLGGKKRNETVFNALEYIRKNYIGAETVVFVDSARPMLSEKMLSEALQAFNGHQGLITCQNITDSLGKTDYSGILNRSEYYLIQTPEIFKMATLNNFSKDSEYTAIALQASSDDIFHWFHNYFNLKITYADDIAIAEKILRE